MTPLFGSSFGNNPALNGEVVNFYRTAVSDFKALSREIGKTLHSREQMHVAKFIYNHPDYISNVQRAWAVWAMSKLCFSSDFTGSFSLCRKGKSQTVQSIDRTVTAANVKRRKQE